MSIEAVSWALRVPVAGNAKLMLIGLANHAHPDGTESYPSLDTLATYGHCDRSTARRNVRRLVSDGWAIEDGLGPRGQSKYRLPVGSSTPERGSQNATPDPGEGWHTDPPGGSKSGQGGVAPVLPEPSLEPSLEPSSGSGPAREAPDGVPRDFPDDLRPHARHVYRVLADLARRHSAKAVNATSLAHVLMARPRHPLVQAAHDYAAWAEAEPQRRRDVVAGYRNWLNKCGELAATEPMPGEEPSGGQGNVARLPSRRREHPADARGRELRELADRLRREEGA